MSAAGMKKHVGRRDEHKLQTIAGEERTKAAFDLSVRTFEEAAQVCYL